MRKKIRFFFLRALDFIYPTSCIHCFSQSKELVCASCLSYFTLLEPDANSFALYCFDDSPIANCILNNFRSSQDIRVSKVIVSFFAIQMLKANLAFPDFVFSFDEKGVRGFFLRKKDRIIAKNFAKFIKTGYQQTFFLKNREKKFLNKSALILGLKKSDTDQETVRKVEEAGFRDVKSLYFIKPID